MRIKSLYIGAVTFGLLLSVGAAFAEETDKAKAAPKRTALAEAKCGETANLSTATAQAIADAVPGIGPKLAARIVEARPQTWDALDAVSGVGPAILAAAQRCATIGGAK